LACKHVAAAGGHPLLAPPERPVISGRQAEAAQTTAGPCRTRRAPY